MFQNARSCPSNVSKNSRQGGINAFDPVENFTALSRVPVNRRKPRAPGAVERVVYSLARDRRSRGAARNCMETKP